MILLNMMMTMPEEISVIRDGSPLEKIPSESLAESLHLTRWNWFFFVSRYGDCTRILITGASPVASTAPKIPIPSGNMNT